eukprot:UN07741
MSRVRAGSKPLRDRIRSLQRGNESTKLSAALPL